MDSSSIGNGGMRTSLGFPVGTAVLLAVLFSLTGIYSCCYHWNRLQRALFPRTADDIEAQGGLRPYSASYFPENLEIQKNFQLPVIIMPGDDVPKFVALPCPCEPPHPEKISSGVFPTLPKQPSPPRIAVPLY